MERQPDLGMSWKQRYIDHGFSVLPELIDREYCERALRAISGLLADDRPLSQWDAIRPGRRYTVLYPSDCAVLDEILENAALLAALEDLFGEYGFHFGENDTRSELGRRMALWVNPYDDNARRALLPLGHIDSGNPYRGIAIHVLFADTEPFGGNTTYFPRTHQLVLKDMHERQDREFRGGTLPQIRRPEKPFELVGRAGDVVFCHHALFHSANPNRSENRLPRIAVRIEVFPRRPLEIVDPARGGSSPWEASFAMVGHHRAP